MEKSDIQMYYDMSKKSFWLYRILPGFLTIVMMAAPFWTSFLGIYNWLIVYLAFIATYVLYEAVLIVVGNIVGYKRMLRDVDRDWRGDIRKLNFNKLSSKKQIPQSLKGLYHVIFIPTYKESYEDLEKGLRTVVDQDYPHMDKVIVVYAVEERAGDEQKKKVRKLIKKYSKYFYGIWDFYHPEGISGEIVGDACANLRWAGVQASKRLKKEKINSQHTVFTKYDSDTRIHSKFLSALTYTYLTSSRRNHKFYSPAVLIYSNNYWRVPSLTRMFSAAMTLGIVSEWVGKKRQKQSFSCYSANFKLLEDINFWDASTGAEDTYFYWNAWLHQDGDFEGEEFYLPVTMDAVEGKNHLGSLNSLYKQQLRWGWGAIIMSIALQGMSNNKKISVIKKIDRFFVLFRVYNFLMTISILLAFSMPVLTFLNRELEFSSVSYLMPRTISIMLTTSLVMQLPQKYYIYKYYGAPPKKSSLLFKVWWWTLESLVTLANVWLYYLLPKLQAQFEMTVGKKRKKFFVSIEGRVND
jgi:cellulose synthase/poly-beta-1,6-N-acetylglucosamine synthase-like glycosyltransferase